MKTSLPCTLPGCDGYGHCDDPADSLCTEPIGEVNLPGGFDISFELYDGPSTGVPHLSILGSNSLDEVFIARFGFREEAVAFAARFHAVAKAIEDAGSQLAAAQAGRAVTR